jgi:hypothetical protein
VVDLEVQCNPPMPIGWVYEVDLSYLSCKDLILGGLKRCIVAARAWNTQDLCGVYFAG